MSSREFEIINNLDIARAHATLFIEERPDYAAATQKLIEEIQRIRIEFVSTVRGKKP